MAGKYDTRLDRASAFRNGGPKRAETPRKEAATGQEASESRDTSPACREFNAARRYAGQTGWTPIHAKRTPKQMTGFVVPSQALGIKSLRGTTGRRIRGVVFWARGQGGVNAPSKWT